MGLRDRLRTAYRSPQNQSFLKLASSSTGAQFFALATAPLLTRLFTPADFGQLALFTAVVTVGATLATLTLQEAIVVTPPGVSGQSDCRALLRLCTASVAVTVVLTIVAVVVAEAIDGPGVTQLGTLLWLLPIGIALLACNQVGIAALVTAKRFGGVASIQLIRPVSTNVMQVLGGAIRPSALTLITAFIAGLVVGIAPAIRTLREFSAVRVRQIPYRKVLRRYRSFPLYELPFTLANNLSLYGQVFVLAIFFSTEELGWFAIAFRLIGLPAAVIASAIAQVLRRDVSLASLESGGRLLLERALRQALISGVPVFLAILLLAPLLLPWVFGPEWVAAGFVAQAMTPTFLARYVSAPLTSVFSIYHKQLWLLVWQICYLALSWFTVVLGGIGGLSLVQTMWLANVVQVPMYLALIPWSLGIARRQRTVEEGK